MSHAAEMLVAGPERAMVDGQERRVAVALSVNRNDPRRQERVTISIRSGADYYILWRLK